MAYLSLDDFDIYRNAARYSDRMYDLVRTWNGFESGTVGSQLVRAADSVGANIAESYGRYHYAERVHFFYYARGSAFETIFWLKRAGQRALLSAETVDNAVIAYTELIASLNKVIKTTNRQRIPVRRRGAQASAVAESREEYLLEEVAATSVPF